MVEASIRAEGASSNALGGCRFVQDAESEGARAKLFRALSTHLLCRSCIEVRKIYPPGEHGQAPRLARAKRWLRNT